MMFNSEQFKKREGERLRPCEIVAHDHTYCRQPDSIQPTRTICCEQKNYIIRQLSTILRSPIRFFFFFYSLVVPHNCDFACWKKGVELPDRYNYNPLEVPLRLGWQR